MLEFEKKLILTFSEYETVISEFKNCSKSTLQTNYYFDTDDFSMNKKGITCRIRFKDGLYTTTIKNHDTEHQDCSYEKKISVKTKPDTEYFEKLNLKLQGKLVTERTLLYQDLFCEMVVDRNVYLGYTDYELEVEYSKEYEQKARLLLLNIAESLVKDDQLSNVSEFLNRAGQGGSKSQRFFKRKFLNRT